MAKNQQKPAADPMLSLKVGSIKETKSGFLVPLIAKLFKGTVALKNVEITFKQGGTEVGKAVTDQTGEAVFNHVVSLSQEDTVINFRAIADTNESSENAVIPKKDKKTKKRKGPKIMRLSRYAHHGRPGVYTIWAEVQGENGSAYKGRVVFWVRGQQHEVQADHNGYAELTLTPIVQEDEVLIITASIHEEHDGIVDSAVITLRRPRVWAQGWTREWFRSARGIAGIARWVILLLLVTFFINVMSTDYDPILMPVKKQLSQEQELLQKLHHYQKVELPQSKGEYPGGYMMFLFFTAIFVYGSSLVVNLGMLRDCVITAYDNISNKFRGHVADPFSERILEWFKLLSVGKEKKSEEKEQKDPEVKSKAGLSFSKLFASEIIAEIVGEIAVKILPAILSKTKLKTAF